LCFYSFFFFSFLLFFFFFFFFWDSNGKSYLHSLDNLFVQKLLPFLFLFFSSSPFFLSSFQQKQLNKKKITVFS